MRFEQPVDGATAWDLDDEDRLRVYAPTLAASALEGAITRC
jgi:hypothetical protein